MLLLVILVVVHLIVFRRPCVADQRHAFVYVYPLTKTYAMFTADACPRARLPKMGRFVYAHHRFGISATMLFVVLFLVLVEVSTTNRRRPFFLSSLP
jgi:hypothetical protein